MTLAQHDAIVPIVTEGTLPLAVSPRRGGSGLEGEVVEYAGEPGSTLAPHDAARRPAVKVGRVTLLSRSFVRRGRGNSPAPLFFAS